MTRILTNLHALFQGESFVNLQWSHLVFLAGNTIYLSTRGLFMRQRAADRKVVSKATTLDWMLILILVVCQVILPTLLLFTPLINWANYSVPTAFRLLAIPIMVVGLWLFWRSHVDLGKCWSVTLKLNQGHELIVAGVYRYMRHPMYSSFFLLAISQAFLLNNWLAGGAAFPAVALLYLIRVPSEETMMIEHFGDEYLCYRQKTNAILPFRGRH